MDPHFIYYFLIRFPKTSLYINTRLFLHCRGRLSERDVSLCSIRIKCTICPYRGTINPVPIDQRMSYSLYVKKRNFKWLLMSNSLVIRLMKHLKSKVFDLMHHLAFVSLEIKSSVYISIPVPAFTCNYLNCCLQTCSPVINMAKILLTYHEISIQLKYCPIDNKQ